MEERRGQATRSSQETSEDGSRMDQCSLGDYVYGDSAMLYEIIEHEYFSGLALSNYMVLIS